MKALGYLCQADRVWHKSDTVGLVSILEVTVHAHHQFHVFAHGVGGVAAHSYGDSLLKQPEGAGYYQQAVAATPAHTAEQESSQIFDDLHHGQKPAGQFYLTHSTGSDVAAVGDPNHAAS